MDVESHRGASYRVFEQRLRSWTFELLKEGINCRKSGVVLALHLMIEGTLQLLPLY